MNITDMEKLTLQLTLFRKEHDLELEFGEIQSINTALDIIDSFIKATEPKPE